MRGRRAPLLRVVEQVFATKRRPRFSGRSRARIAHSKCQACFAPSPVTSRSEPVAKVVAHGDRTRAASSRASSWDSPNRCPPKRCSVTDGPTRTVKIGTTTIQLRRTTARNMATAGRLSGLLTQALRELGKEHVTPERRAHLKRTLPAEKRRELIEDLKLAPAWMRAVFRELAEEDARNSPSSNCPPKNAASISSRQRPGGTYPRSSWKKISGCAGCSASSPSRSSQAT